MANEGQMPAPTISTEGILKSIPTADLVKELKRRVEEARMLVTLYGGLLEKREEESIPVAPPSA